MFVVVLILQNIPDLFSAVVVAIVVVAIVAIYADDDDVDVADAVAEDGAIASAFRDIHPSHHVRRCFDSLEYSIFNSLLLL